MHPSVVAGCESLVLLRMNSLRDVGELEAAFSHVPEGLLRLAPGFVRGEALVAGALAPAPLHLRDRRADHARGRRRRAVDLGASTGANAGGCRLSALELLVHERSDDRDIALFLADASARQLRFLRQMT